MYRNTQKSNSPLRFLIWGYIVWSLVPVMIAVIFSFNDGRSRTVWQGFSFRWWWQDPNSSVFQNAEMRNAIVNSLVLAISTLLIVTPLGIALAIGSQRIRGRSEKFVQGLTPFLPLWARFDAWHGRQVVVSDTGQTLARGRSLGIAPSGALRLLTDEGERHIVAGDLSLRAEGQA